MDSILRVKELGCIDLISEELPTKKLAIPARNLDRFSVLPLASSGTYPIEFEIKFVSVDGPTSFVFVLEDEGARYEVRYDEEIKSVKVDWA